MAHTTIEQFATELKMPAGALIEQLTAAGVDGKQDGDKLTEQDKTRLLDYLRKQHGAAAEPKKRITLTRKQTTRDQGRRLQRQVAHDPGRGAQEARARSARGRSAAVPTAASVEDLVAAPEVEPVERPRARSRCRKSQLRRPKRRRIAVAEIERAVPHRRHRRRRARGARDSLSHLPRKSPPREEESRKDAGARPSGRRDELREKQEREAARKTKKERDAEEAAAKAAADAAARAKAAEKPRRPIPRPRRPEGTLHRPAAKPGEKRERRPRRRPARCSRKRPRAAVRSSCAATPAVPAHRGAGWRGPKVGGRHRDEDGGDALAQRVRPGRARGQRARDDHAWPSSRTRCRSRPPRSSRP